MKNTEQIELQPVPENKQDGLISGFFAVGIVINIVMITAYFIWAVKHWGKKEKLDE
ncbi:MAG: hypothetical protein GY770_02130 [Aestuariibacter sp.]|nr:hypothetical protein [Aestuariibacter sp.]